MLPGVRSCYDEGKRTAETLAMDYHRGADVQVGHFQVLLAIYGINVPLSFDFVGVFIVLWLGQGRVRL